MVRHGKTSFQDSWLLDPEISSWIKKCPGDIYSAKCVLCVGSVISVSTMGRQALISHSKSKKHILKVQSTSNNQPTVSDFFNKPSSLSINTEPKGHTLVQSQEQSVSSQIASPSCSTSVHFTQSSPQAPNRLVHEEFQIINVPTIEKAPHEIVRPIKSMKNKLILHSQVTRAEVIWCLNAVHSHKSRRSAAKDINILKFMFPENETLQNMALERTKIGYLISFGLAPLYKSQLINDVVNSENFVLSFDESLNKISQSQQMDIVVLGQ